MWLATATAIDDLLYTQVVRRSSFSSSGVLQLQRDVGALAALFQPLCSPHKAPLQRLNECCRLLSLDATVRTELLTVLLTDTPEHSHRAEHESHMRRQLESVSVFRISVGEAVEVLACLQE